MRKYIQLLIFVVLVFAACNPITLPPAQNGGNPIFKAVLDFDDDIQDVTLQAGVDDYYLFTSTSTIDPEIKVFSGELRELDCLDNCGPSLTIRFRDVEQGGSGNIDQVLDLNRDITFQGEDQILIDSFATFLITAIADPINFSPAVGSLHWELEGDSMAQMGSVLTLIQTRSDSF